MVRFGVGPFLFARSRHSGRKSLRRRCSYNGRTPAQCTCYVSMIHDSQQQRAAYPHSAARSYLPHRLHWHRHNFDCSVLVASLVKFGTGKSLTCISGNRAPTRIRRDAPKTNKFHHSDSSPGLGEVGDYKGSTPSADRGSPCTCTVALSGPTPVSARGVTPTSCRFRRTVRHRGREALPPQRSEGVRSCIFL